jgi:hypothetical protein
MSSNYQRIQLRRGTIESFDAFNPVLLSGEPVIALQNGSGIFKVGDGINSYSNIAGLRIDVDETITSGLAVYASGQAVRVSGAITTEINNLVDSAPGALNTLNEIAAAINDDSNFIGTFLASGHAYTNALGGVSGVLDTISGIAVYASGSGGGGGGSSTFVGLSDTPSNFSGAGSKFLKVNSSANAVEFSTGAGDVSTAELEHVSGIAVYASGQQEPLSGILSIASGIAVFASGKALAGGGSGPSSDDFNLVSGIAVQSSGQDLLLTASSGLLNTSVGLLETNSGLLNTSVGVLEVNSGLLNTSVGLLETNSGLLNTSVGLKSEQADFATMSGITIVSQSGNFGYHTYRSGGSDSSASGNVSGVTNMVVVDHGAYNSLDKKTNTLYFIPSGT